MNSLSLCYLQATISKIQLIFIGVIVWYSFLFTGRILKFNKILAHFKPAELLSKGLMMCVLKESWNSYFVVSWQTWCRAATQQRPLPPSPSSWEGWRRRWMTTLLPGRWTRRSTWWTASSSAGPSSTRTRVWESRVGCCLKQLDIGGSAGVGWCRGGSAGVDWSKEASAGLKLHVWWVFSKVDLHSWLKCLVGCRPQYGACVGLVSTK